MVEASSHPTNDLDSTRLHALDATRASAMLLGIVFHSSLSFVDKPIPWPVPDSSGSMLFSFLALVLHAFRMPVFFLMAGFFGHLLLVRYGLRGFIRHRVRRTVVPFLVCVVLLVPLLEALFVSGYAAIGDARFQEMAQFNPGIETYRTTVREYFATGAWLREAQPFHLWFLWYLIFYYAASIAAVSLPLRSVAARAGQLLKRVIRSRWKAVWLAVPTTMLLYPVQPWSADAPTTFLPIPRLMVYYGFFFWIGWLLYRESELIVEFARAWQGHLTAGLLIVPVTSFLVYPGAGLREVAGWMRIDFQHVYHVISIVSFALTVWTLAFGFVGFFIRYFDRRNAAVRYVSDSAYWCYLVHLPVVVAMQMIVVSLPAGSFVKFGIVLISVTVVAMTSYEYIVRYSFLGRALHGPRQRRQS